MAMKITNKEWKMATMDGIVAVGGGQLLDTYVVQNVSFINDLLMKLPSDLAGISVKAVVLGILALAVVKMFQK